MLENLDHHISENYHVKKAGKHWTDPCASDPLLVALDPLSVCHRLLPPGIVMLKLDCELYHD